MQTQHQTSNFDQKTFNTNEKPKDVRKNNIMAAKTLADIIRTSLGPRGMDKMIRNSRGEVTITNDGATILKQMQVMHPTAKMLVEISKAQDIEAGDGTTSVVVFAGALLSAAQGLLDKNIHPTVITDGYQYAMEECQKILCEIEKPISLNDREELIRNAITSLSSKVVSNYSSVLAPIAVDSVLKLVKDTDTNIDLRDIRVSKKLGGTIDDSEICEGLVFTNYKASGSSTTGITRVVDPVIGLIQFCLSSPKTEMENTVVVNEYSAMDRIITEERNYIVNLVKKIRAAKCNVLLIQKSILRDAVNEMALHFLAKAGIMVIKNIERDDIEFISKTLGCIPVAHIDQFTPDKLGKAKICEEATLSEGSKVVKINGVANPGATVSVLVRGSNQLLLDEAERSLRDALCVVRSIVKRKAILPGGGAPETEMSLRLYDIANKIKGLKSYCVKAYAEALEVIPFTLAENAGLNPINIVTELRNKHLLGEKHHGINVKKGEITNMFDEHVIQPSLVTSSALKLATEVVRLILKIDDIVICR